MHRHRETHRIASMQLPSGKHLCVVLCPLWARLKPSQYSNLIMGCVDVSCPIREVRKKVPKPSGAVTRRAAASSEVTLVRRDYNPMVRDSISSVSRRRFSPAAIGLYPSRLICQTAAFAKLLQGERFCGCG
jgi:hypothetical protein